MRDYDSTVLLQGARKMMLQATKLCSWQMTPDLTLQFSNCENGHFFFDTFLVSACPGTLKAHFESHDTPAVLADEIGFTWIAAAQKERDSVTEYHLLGPFFIVEASEQYLIRLCSRLRISSELSGELRKRLKQIPTIPIQVALNYAVMLQYYAVGKEVAAGQITYVLSEPMQQSEGSWDINALHNSWEAEQALFQGIRDGTLNLEASSLTATFSGSTIGTLCPWDPLRQAKDELIVLVVLASRAAILGGVSPEWSYSVADYFFQRIEASDTVGMVQNCSLELLQTIIPQVRKAKENQDRSGVIRACMEYVQTHIYEKIQLEEMAKALGYAPYYLSKRFKAEVGTSLNDYIKRQKIERAKAMLTRPNASIAEISERLAFSSPSYFCTVFKQHTGMMPSEYQNTPTQEV